MKSNRDLVLVASTPYGTMRLWFAPEFENRFSKISIWGGVDSRDPGLGASSVEISEKSLDFLRSMFPDFRFTDDARSALALWGCS